MWGDTSCVRVRVLIAGVLCLASMIYGIVQSNMSIIILAMTKPIYDTEEEPPDYGPRFEWSAYEQSLVIGSFFWGSMIVSPVTGVLSERYGPRYIVGIALILASILSALTPVSSNILPLAIVLRFVSGILIGTVYPSLQALTAKWAPPEEKGIFLSALTAGGIGNIIDWSMTGFIIESFGWKYGFYVVTIILGIFLTFWFLIVYDSPSKHPRCTQAERDYIIQSLQSTTTKKKPWPPIKSILLSIPVYALCILQFGASWGQYFVVAATPRYLSEVHNITISITGVVGSIPYVARLIGGILFGLIGDFLLKKKIMNANAIRKSFCLCSHVIPGCLLIGLTFFGGDTNICVAFMTLAMGFTGATSITNLPNSHDITPNFASTVYGIILLFGASAGFIVPLVVAYFIQEKSSEAEWRNIFFTGAGVYIATGIIFIIFGSGYIQKWNEIKEDNDESTVENKRVQDNVSIKSK